MTAGQQQIDQGHALAELCKQKKLRIPCGGIDKGSGTRIQRILSKGVKRWLMKLSTLCLFLVIAGTSACLFGCTEAYLSEQNEPLEIKSHRRHLNNSHVGYSDNHYYSSQNEKERLLQRRNGPIRDNQGVRLERDRALIQTERAKARGDYTGMSTISAYQRAEIKRQQKASARAAAQYKAPRN